MAEALRRVGSLRSWTGIHGASWLTLDTPTDFDNKDYSTSSVVCDIVIVYQWAGGETQFPRYDLWILRRERDWKKDQKLGRRFCFIHSRWMGIWKSHHAALSVKVGEDRSGWWTFGCGTQSACTSEWRYYSLIGFGRSCWCSFTQVKSNHVIGRHYALHLTAFN